MNDHSTMPNIPRPEQILVFGYRWARKPEIRLVLPVPVKFQNNNRLQFYLRKMPNKSETCSSKCMLRQNEDAT